MLHETIPRVVVGVLLLFFGWHLYRLGIKAVGFYFGFLIGASVWGLVLTLTEGKVDLPRGQIADLAAGVVLGFIGAYLSFRLYQSLLWAAAIGGCLYLAYATPHFELLYNLMGQVGILTTLQERLGEFLPGAIALILAAVVLLMHRHIVMIATAGTGAHLVSSVTPYPILFFPLFLIGLGVQAVVRKKRKSRDSEE
ncbi:MAG TPA: hypothetical protein PLY86_17260 [bacterium]|nr:hypothetical protein [bacterium]